MCISSCGYLGDGVKRSRWIDSGAPVLDAACSGYGGDKVAEGQADAAGSEELRQSGGHSRFKPGASSFKIRRPPAFTEFIDADFFLAASSPCSVTVRTHTCARFRT